MTTVAAAQVTPAKEEENGCNEAQIESALKRLQEMHVQLRHLRDAIPRLVDPMLTRQHSPEDLYTVFATNVTTARSEVKDLANALREESYKEVLMKAQESRTQSDEHIRGWRVTEHEDWLDVQNVDSPPKFGLHGNSGSDQDGVQRMTFDSERLPAILEEFRKSNPSIEVSLNEDPKVIKVSLPPQAYTHFEINEPPNHESISAYIINTTEKTNMHAAIVKAINSDRRANDFEYLFEMLAAYSDIRSRSCSKCNRLLDPNAQYPIIRTKKKSRQSDGQYRLLWQALHKGCG